MVRHKRPHGVRLRSLFLWHRWLGLSAAIFIVALAVTGLLINFSDDLRLDRRHVQSDWLLDWYGIRPPAMLVAYPVAGHWISQVGQRLYFDERELEATAPLHGAVATPDGITVAAGNQIVLLSADGTVIDRLGSLEGVPADITTVGVRDQALLVRTPTGAFQGNTRTLAWQSTDSANAVWARPAPLPAPLRTALVQRYRGAGISWERVVLDLHSGRLFGAFGVAVINVAGVLMVLLAFTGLWHFFRRRR